MGASRLIVVFLAISGQWTTLGAKSEPFDNRQVENLRLVIRVVDHSTSLGVPSSEVKLQKLDSWGARPIEVSSDSEGEAHFANLSSGDYLIVVTKGGYTTQGTHVVLKNLASTADGGSGSGASPQATVVNVAISAEAQISGRVTYGEGMPVPDAEVICLYKSFDQGVANLFPVAQTTTDGAGSFHVSGLGAGSHYLFVKPNADETAKSAAKVSAELRRVVPGFYPSGDNDDGVGSIDLVEGATFKEANVHLKSQPTFQLSGKLSVASSNSSRRDVYAIELRPATAGSLSANLMLARQVAAPPAYEFHFAGIPAGEYIIVASPVTAIRTAVSTANVDLSKSDVKNVTLNVGAGAIVRGKIVGDASLNQPFAQSGIFTSFRMEARNLDNPTLQPITVVPSAAGEFRFEGLPSGRTIFTPQGLPKALFVKQISSAGHALEHNTLELHSESAVDLTIELSSPAASLDGTVVNDKSATLPGAIVVLSPEDARDGPLRVSTADSDGRFCFQGISPGSYKVLSWRSIDRSRVEDFELIRRYTAQSESIDLKPGAVVHRSVVALSAAPSY